MHQNSNGAKKSFYLFLSSLLGLFLFFILHRVGMFIYLYFVGEGYFLQSFVYWRFLAIDYTTLFLALFAGVWYGIWLGSFWYVQIYEQGSHGGLADHLVRHYWSVNNKPKNLGSKLALVKENLEQDLWDLESLVKTTTTSPVVNPEPKVRRVIRKKAPKKLMPIK